MDQERLPPALATAARHLDDGAWSLRVPCCPLCGAAHWHSGGYGETPIYGARAAHCTQTEPLPAAYELIPMESEQGCRP